MGSGSRCWVEEEWEEEEEVGGSHVLPGTVPRGRQETTLPDKDDG